RGRPRMRGRSGSWCACVLFSPLRESFVRRCAGRAGTRYSSKTEPSSTTRILKWKSVLFLHRRRNADHIARRGDQVRAASYIGEGRIEPREIEPVAPGPDEVRIRV